MQWHELILSRKRRPRVLRHLAFWSAWWLYFFLCFSIFQLPLPGDVRPFYLTPGDPLPVNTFLLLLLFIPPCYALVYLVLPRFLKGQYLAGLFGLLLLGALLFIASDLLYWQILTGIDAFHSPPNTLMTLSPSWPAINLGLMNFIKVAAAAVIIKYLKTWWLEQEESLRLEREKTGAELQLLKAQVHPDFLINTLDNLHDHAQASSPGATGILLRFSDILSYMLYECDRSVVPLEKEIAIMQEYIQLEKTRLGKGLEIQVNIQGDMAEKNIAPFLLLPFVENSLKLCGRETPHHWVNLDITIDGASLSLKIVNGIPESASYSYTADTYGLDKVRKRLALLYPGNHALKMTTEQEMFIVLLHIHLINNPEFSFEEPGNPSPVTGSENAGEQALKYATY